MRKTIIMFVLCLFVAGVASAQKAEVFGGYSFLRVSDQGSSVNFNGGSGSVAFNANKWLGVVADFGAYHANVSGVSGNLYTYMFGPKLSYHSGKITAFGQALFGGAHGTASGSCEDASPAAGCGGSDNAFAMAVGGGFDAKVAPHVAVRLIQAEYLMTKFNDGVNNRQNCARISAGIVFRF